jgi:aspartyl-tRNA(Asn)/glutamyl-tRNA(Gln) amidotransferase subunit C
MANLTHDDVLKLASLAKLELQADELERYRDELDAVLMYVEQLTNVDTSDLEPTHQVTGLRNVMRKDEIKDYGISNEALLQNLPNREGNLIKVKRVL